MRLWSIHPKYLDAKGLTALWREGLLAKKVLEDKTKGYRNHPQLIRFRKSPKPLSAINAYLYNVYMEARARGYSFDRSKIRRVRMKKPIKVTTGQVDFEVKHLLLKLKKRDKSRLEAMKAVKKAVINGVFIAVKGGIEDWEKAVNGRRFMK